MLKIKDNIDLKELEKYSFKYIEGFGYYYSNDKDSIFVKIEFDKTIEVYSKLSSNCNIIYDLIQAGLVEKVEE